MCGHAHTHAQNDSDAGTRKRRTAPARREETYRTSRFLERPSSLESPVVMLRLVVTPRRIVNEEVVVVTVYRVGNEGDTKASDTDGIHMAVTKTR